LDHSIRVQAAAYRQRCNSAHRSKESPYSTEKKSAIHNNSFKI
jgi:hypothetical protein